VERFENKMLIYVGFSFLHHGDHAGYDQIRKYLDYHRIIDCQKGFAFMQKRSLLSRVYIKYFGSWFWWVELRLIIMSILRPNRYIFHLIYGENIYKHLGKFKFRNKIVLTLHQPPSFFLEEERSSFLESLKMVDKLIVMSPEMESYFKSIFADKEIKYIPHGIDTQFFTPKGEKNNQILMIGNWLRNFEFAAKVFQTLSTNNNKLTFVVLTNANNHSYFADIPVKLLSNVEDHELLKLYQQSKLVFLPLTQFTANNAFLEACSCGCSVIIATDKGNFLTNSESTAIFVENNIQMVCEMIQLQIEKWSVEKESENRIFVTSRYNWKQIADKTEQFLRS